ncbi:MAG TPA: CAP domain-containing protein [Parachlamydiaceae bacterium]|nr:CAP domain-containing protein [Parachlamydiaceae bacterium]
MKKILRTLCILLFPLTSLCAQEIPLIPSKAVSEAAQPLLESEVFHLINRHRIANLLKPLKWSSPPAHLAREHSLNMANGAVPFGHQGAELRFDELRNKITSLTSFGENVAYNYGYSQPAQVAVNGWLASPGHYANIMGDYNLAGVGVAKNLKGEYYFTQIFVKANLALLNSLEGKDEQLCSEKQANISEFSVQFDN